MHASGTQALTGGLSPQMDPSAQYRRFAEECRRLVEQVESERHRRILHEMALAWSKPTRASERDFSLRPDGIRLWRRPASCRPSETRPAPSAAGLRGHAGR